MTRRSISIELSLWERAIEKANGLMSLSAIVRRLLEMWLNDEIDLTKKRGG